VIRLIVLLVALGFVAPDANACCFKLFKRHHRQQCQQQIMMPVCPMPVTPVCPMPIPVCPVPTSPPVPGKVPPTPSPQGPGVNVPPGGVCPLCPPAVTKPAPHFHWW
jgi:hypothetical protein